MSNLDIFLHALRLQESGGNYSARNSSSGASGAYQFTWGTWLYALSLAGLRRYPYNYESANNAPHWVQDAAAKALVKHYYNEFSNSYYNVAEAWYGGPGAVGHPNWGGGPGYPTVGQYASQVMQKYHNLGGGGSTTSSKKKATYISESSPTLVRHYEWGNHLLRYAIANNTGWIKYSAKLVR